MDQHGQQLAETYLSMLNTHDPDLVDQFVADEYRNHNAFVADGREANRQFWTMFFAALPDLSVTMEDLVISGDRVVGRFVYRGTHTGELMGIPASGNPVEMRVEKQQVAEGGVLEQQRAQSDRAADVGRDDAGDVKSPMLEQSGEAAALRGDAEVLTLTLLRLAVAEMIKEEHSTVTRERRGDRAPDQRRVRSALHEHYRRSVADTRPADLATVCVKPSV
jgi:predicted ester cyclase